MEKTYYPKGKQVSDWILVDASGQGLGRLATKIANYLMGKHKPSFTPGVDAGDHVVVVNVDRLNLSQKRLEQKIYYRHSGYPGGLKQITLRDQMLKRPEKVIFLAVRGMLPQNKYGRQLLRKLKVYAGSEHPHAAQNPQPISEGAGK